MLHVEREVREKRERERKRAIRDACVCGALTYYGALTYCVNYGVPKAARDGDTDAKPGEIPDGFYLVADSTNPQAAWHAAIIEAVRKVTHIAPPDAEGKIINEPVLQVGQLTLHPNPNPDPSPNPYPYPNPDPDPDH